jgi:hypothetical protein
MDGPGVWLRADGHPCAAVIQRPAASVAWELDVVPSPDAGVSLTWAEPAGVPSGQLVTLVEVDDQGAPVAAGLGVDLRREAELAVPPGMPRRFSICSSPETSFELALTAGWNLVSLPISPALPAAAAVFGERATVAIESSAVLAPDPAGGGYVPASVIEALHGYWVYSPVDELLAVLGVALGEPALVLGAGWNLVGVPESRTDLPGADLGVGPWLEYSPPQASFVPTRRLVVGQAYWVFSPAPVTLPLGARQ